MSDLRAVVVIDHQNAHLTRHGLFQVSRHGPKHDSLVDPLPFAHQLLQARNANQTGIQPQAVLSRVLVFRGEPSATHDPDDYDRSLAQKAHWERDTRVRVKLRSLKYNYNHVHQVTGKREKGVDVLCALALVREAREPDTDLVILASHDGDLEPALHEALSLGLTKVATFCWYDSCAGSYQRQLRPSGDRRVWNNRLDETAFQNCSDRTDYRNVTTVA